jgi:diguanylate cyclase (GGDEF)-like protein/PAS domain S-box-containing protein
MILRFRRPGLAGAAGIAMILRFLKDGFGVAAASHAALLQSVISRVPIVIWAVDRDGVITLSDGQGLHSLGLKPGELVGRSALEVYAGAPALIAAIRRALGGEGFVAEIPVGDRVLETWCAPVRHNDGAVTGVNGLSLDITERVRTERALEESERKYRELVDEAASIILRFDSRGVVTFFNEYAQRFFGYREEEIVGRNVVGTIVPEHEFTGRDLAELIDDICANTDKYEYNENENIKRSGDRVWIAWKNRPVYDTAGNVVEVLSVGIDITARKHTEENLRRSEAELSAILDSMLDTYYRVDCDGYITRISASGRELLGYSPHELVGTWVGRMYYDSDGRDQLLASLEAAGGALHDYIVPLRHRDGYPVWASISARFLRDAEGVVTGIEGIVRDATERRRAEAQIRLHAHALEQTADAVLITDRDGVIEYVNPAFERDTGYSRDEAIGKKPNLIRSDVHSLEFFARLWETILRGEVFSDVLVNRRRDGSLYYEEKTITPLKDDKGRITHFIATGKDITERMRTQERLHFLAHHDVLTSLPNRMLFMDRLEHALALARSPEFPVAVLFLDLDRFKTINDSLGHGSGDRALQTVATRLNEAVRRGDTVARLGGDEFALILENVTGPQAVAPIARKLLEVVSQPVALEGREYVMTASIGISLCPGDGTDAATLLKHADIALYRAKDSGRNAFQFYSADMGAKAFERLNLETSLRRALARGEFALYYQPQVDTDSGCVFGLEALLRWRHPELGLVGPGMFVPVLEEIGLIGEVGEWVLHEACAQAQVWQALSPAPLRMAVNLSARQFHATDLPAAVERALTASGLDARLLEVEVTESVLMQQSAATMESFRALDARGVRIALDDFGTGYSSLSHLRRFPVDLIKIDRAFVRDVCDDPDDAAIVCAILAMAENLKLQAIAEGVDTPGQLQFLRDHGCSLVQGYLFSEPLPAERVPELVRTGFERSAVSLP